MIDLIKYSKELPFIQDLDAKKIEIDSCRPLSNDLNNHIFQKLRLDWNYNSNAIEGNSLTHGETIALLMEGITAKGKPLKDALDIKGHNEAIDFMMEIVKNERPLTEIDIRSLHKLVLGEEYYNEARTAEGQKTRKLIKLGQYKTSPNHVKTATGEIHYYATPEETPRKMQQLVDWYNEAAAHKEISKIVLAALFHHKFVEIHPFDDGNGRMSRILTNFMLLKFGYPIIVIKEARRKEYYATLSQADNGQNIPIIEFISECLDKSLTIYLKAINGIDISESDDIDKEIALFRSEIGFKPEIKKFRTTESSLEISYKVFSYINEKLEKFNDLFYESKKTITGDSNIIGDTDFTSINNFEKLIPNIEKKSRIKFEYNLTQDIFNKKSSLNFILLINFKEESYILKSSINNHNTQSLIKYYDQGILDTHFINFAHQIVKDVMDQMKTIKKNKN